MFLGLTNIRRFSERRKSAGGRLKTKDKRRKTKVEGGKLKTKDKRKKTKVESSFIKYCVYMLYF